MIFVGQLTVKSTPTPGFPTESAEGRLAVINLTSRCTRHRNKHNLAQRQRKIHSSPPMGRGWRLDTGDQHWDERTGEGEGAGLPDRSEEKRKERINTSCVSYRRPTRVTLPLSQGRRSEGDLDGENGSGGAALLGQWRKKDWCYPSMALSPSRCGHKSSPWSGKRGAHKRWGQH